MLSTRVEQDRQIHLLIERFVVFTRIGNTRPNLILVKMGPNYFVILKLPKEKYLLFSGMNKPKKSLGGGIFMSFLLFTRHFLGFSGYFSKFP